MPRTAAPATPGTSPKTDDAPEVTADAGAEMSLAERLAILEKRDQEKDAELARLRQQVGRAVEPANKVELPKLADVAKQKPDIPVLTADGWYVPPMLPGAAGKS